MSDPKIGNQLAREFSAQLLDEQVDLEYNEIYDQIISKYEQEFISERIYDLDAEEYELA